MLQGLKGEEAGFRLSGSLSLFLPSFPQFASIIIEIKEKEAGCRPPLSKMCRKWTPGSTSVWSEFIEKKSVL